MDRTEQLKEILAVDPGNAFARYGLAMERSNADQIEEGLREFRTLVEAHPDYAAGYFMAAQMLARVNRKDEARQWLRDGIEAAERSGNRHASGEMEAMLAELG